MIDLKPQIVQALRNHATLVDLLGGEKIGAQVAPVDAALPYLTFFELTNFDSNYAENQAMTSEIHIQVDVWSCANTGPISFEANRVMEELEFVRTGAIDRYEHDTKTYHKVLRYKTIVRR